MGKQPGDSMLNDSLAAGFPIPLQVPIPIERLSRNRLRILMLVEGLHDVEFLKRISTVLRTIDSRSPDLAHLEQTGDLVFIPTCGNPAYWIGRLSVLSLAECHLIDGETSPTRETRIQIAAAINKHKRCRAFVTRFRSLENYLHPAAIEAVSGLRVEFTGTDDVPAIVGQAMYKARQPTTPWSDLSPRARKRFGERAKKWLNTDAVAAMTSDQLAAADPHGEVASWMAVFTALSQGH